ncbi:MAG: hypothetical protein FD133_1310 [Erysipelotrichaceae bacterium]|nr:MAG: hypothetical protein FD179_1290 [Erysipelotrichaceae bacterium]TXT17606.1 MAG: hypothetical protein FD133_1310 [Erysipelotrichaceae bacterium]
MRQFLVTLQSVLNDFTIFDGAFSSIKSDIFRSLRFKFIFFLRLQESVSDVLNSDIWNKPTRYLGLRKNWF